MYFLDKPSNSQHQHSKKCKTLTKESLVFELGSEMVKIEGETSILDSYLPDPARVRFLRVGNSLLHMIKFAWKIIKALCFCCSVKR